MKSPSAKTYFNKIFRHILHLLKPCSIAVVAMEYAMLQNIIALLFSLGGGLRLREERYKTSITVNSPEIRSSNICDLGSKL